jgi:hypothetical protein
MVHYEGSKDFTMANVLRDWFLTTMLGANMCLLQGTFAAQPGKGLAGQYAQNATITITGIDSISIKTINIQDFGAKCDGTTDDTYSIQKALDSISTGSSEIIFKEGVCIISASLYVQGKANFSISGYGSTIKAKDGMLAVADTQLLRLIESTDFKVEGLTLDGNRQNRIPSENPSHLLEVKAAKRFFGGTRYSKERYGRRIYRQRKSKNSGDRCGEILKRFCIS